MSRLNISHFFPLRYHQKGPIPIPVLRPILNTEYMQTLKICFDALLCVCDTEMLHFQDIHACLHFAREYYGTFLYDFSGRLDQTSKAFCIPDKSFMNMLHDCAMCMWQILIFCVQHFDVYLTYKCYVLHVLVYLLQMNVTVLQCRVLYLIYCTIVQVQFLAA